MKFLLICNPGSRGGRGQRRWQYWIDQLQLAGMEVEQAVTETPADARRFVIETDADTVVAVGGDGTINRVLDGVLTSSRRDLRMGVLYAGTSPDFCRFYNIPITPAGAITALLQGVVCQVDAAQILLRTAAGEKRCHFGCSANIGLGPDIAQQSNAWRPCVGDLFGTGGAAVKAICRMQPMALQLEIDDRAIELDAVNNLTIALNPFLASGIKLDLPLRPDDGTMAIAAICGQGRAGLLRLLPDFYTGRIVDHPDVKIFTARRLRVRSETPHAVEFDGDPRGVLPVTVEILPGRLPLICANPQESGSHHA